MRQNFKFGDLKKILYTVTSKCFLVFNAVFHVRWTNSVKVIIVAQDVSRMIF